MRLWWEMASILKLCGYHKVHTRISNEVSLKMLLKLGVKIVSEICIEKDDFIEKMWMIKIDFNTQYPTYSQMMQMK